MKSLAGSLAWVTALLPLATAQNATITLVPVATGFDSDNAAFYYARSPVLIANDGSAADGGFRTFSTSNSTAFKEVAHLKTGRSKIAIPVYDVGGRDVVMNIPAPDSILRVFNAETMEEVGSARKKQLGDWSVARTWRSQTSGENYIFLFGKKMVVQLLIRDKGGVEILEVGWLVDLISHHSELKQNRFKRSQFPSKVKRAPSSLMGRFSSQVAREILCTRSKLLKPLQRPKSRPWVKTSRLRASVHTTVTPAITF